MKSVLIIGYGRFGRHMAAKLIEEGNSVLVVEKDEERANDAIDVIKDIQIGDATNETFIASLGVSNFDFCVVAIANNFQHVLETTVLLKEFGAKYVIARAQRDVHKKLLLRNGADHVVYAERELAERLAIKYGAKNVFDYMEIAAGIGMYEIAVPIRWFHKSIASLAVRTKYNVSILAIKRDGEIYPLPSPDHIFEAGETLMVMGSEKSIHNLTK